MSLSSSVADGGDDGHDVAAERGRGHLDLLASSAPGGVEREPEHGHAHAEGGDRRFPPYCVRQAGSLVARLIRKMEIDRNRS